MRRMILVPLLAISAASLVVVTLPAAANAAAPRAVARTFTLVERATTDVVTDTGKKGDSAGDLLTFANDLYNASNTTKVGTDNGFCVRTVVGTAWECWWTATLAGGQITVQGPFYDAGDSNLAITGGTGIYKRARGFMTLHARNAEGSEYDFTYHVKR